MTDGNLAKLAEHERQRDAECDAGERGEAVFLDRFAPVLNKACAALQQIREAIQALRDAQHEVAQNGGSLDFVDDVRDWSVLDFGDEAMSDVQHGWESFLEKQAQDIADNMADEYWGAANGDDE